MSYFKQLLQNRDLYRHHNRPLWTYDLSDTEFNDLELKLKKSTSLDYVDKRDYTLYFSEWWRRRYQGGKASIDEVCKQISNHYITNEIAYRLAKEGAVLLNLNWIKQSNTLYFRTLLMQGGVPLGILQKDTGVYKRFLMELIEINASSISDIYDCNTLRYLPKSAQNDDVYQNCLEIVKAVLDEDETYLSYFNSNDDLKEIKEALIRTKKQVTLKRSISKFKCYWICDLNTGRINLQATQLGTITTDEVSRLIVVNSSSLEKEYKVFVNDIIAARFVRRDSERFTVFNYSFRNDVLLDINNIPEICVVSGSGISYDVSTSVLFNFNFSEPILLKCIDEEKFLLEKRRNILVDKGGVFVPSNWHVSESSSDNVRDNRKIGDYDIITFADFVELESQEQKISFRLNQGQKFDWLIKELPPLWVKKANYRIVTGKPTLFFYDNNGQLVKDVEVFSRRYNNSYGQWKALKDDIWDVGLYELKFLQNGVEEFDRVYNVSRLNFSIDSTLISSSITFDNFNNLEIEAVHTEEYDIQNRGRDQLIYTLNSSGKLPLAVKFNVGVQSQSAKLKVEIGSPFLGVELLSPDQTVFIGSDLFVEGLSGYRLLANSPNKKYFITFYNSGDPDIRITRKLEKSITSLLEFDEHYQMLFKISNVLDSEKHVVIAISEETRDERLQIVNSYKLFPFKSKITPTTVDKVVKVSLADGVHSSLVAVPLECAFTDIRAYELVEEEGGVFNFEGIKESLEKFIVFSSDESESKVQPRFIDLAPYDKDSLGKTRYDRHHDYCTQLLDSEYAAGIWQGLESYYYLCKYYQIPCSTFDIIKSISVDSFLAARAFVYFSRINADQFWIEELENDLGFCFHWVALKDWHEVLETDEDKDALINYLSKVSERLSIYVQSESLGKELQYFNIREATQDMRSRLGIRLLEELPSHAPKVEKKLRFIHSPDSRLLLLVNTPVAVACSITSQQTVQSIWGPYNENIRKYMRYAIQVDPDWYKTALLYSIYKSR